MVLNFDCGFQLWLPGIRHLTGQSDSLALCPV